MRNIVPSLCIVIVVVLNYANAGEEVDYYWRDYTGYIPDDAVPGGLDRNNATTYLGQLLVTLGGKQQGLQPVRIYKGQSSVTASQWGMITSDKFIKILCSPKPEKFYWENGNAADLHLTTIGKHLVPAGAENNRILNFGRVHFQGELIVGKVVSYRTGIARMRFPYDGVENNFDSYQILVYDIKPPVLEV